MVDQIVDLVDAVLDTTPAVVTPEAAALLGESKNAVGDARGYATQSANALTQLASWLANATSTPQAYATLSDLKADRPQGSGIAVVIADGFLYWWDASAKQWKKGSQYQSMGLTDGQLGVLANALARDRQIANAAQIVAPYDNLDTLPLNSVVTYAIADGVTNLPNGSMGTVLTFTGTSATSGAIQIFVTPSGVMWHRVAWGMPAQWGSWKSPQANALARDRQIANAAQIVAPYDNLDTLPLNSVVTYAIADGVTNLPNGSMGTVLTFTGTSATSGAVQIFVDYKGVMWHRVAWGMPAQWRSWKSPQYDRIADASLPSLSMFGHIGVIGDSYASGQISFDGVWGTSVDNVKWPVMLARKWGISYLDLAKPGLSTRTWLTDDKGLSRLNASDPQDLYLFCLGINDYYGLGPTYLGTPDDIDSGVDTFYGNAGRILKAVRSKAPNAKTIVFGLASDKGAAPQFDAALKTIAARFAIPFIEQTSEPFFTSTYYTNNLSGGHPTGPLYGAMALAMERLIQRAVVDHYPYFQRYGYTPAATG